MIILWFIPVETENELKLQISDSELWKFPVNFLFSDKPVFVSGKPFQSEANPIRNSVVQLLTLFCKLGNFKIVHNGSY